MIPQEKLLLKISLIASVIGLIGLFFISSNSELNVISISNINENLIDKEIRIIGTIKYYKDSPSLKILKVEDNTGSISIIVFKNEESNLKTKLKVEITGTVRKYKSELEIIAKNIRIY